MAQPNTPAATNAGSPARKRRAWIAGTAAVATAAAGAGWMLLRPTGPEPLEGSPVAYRTFSSCAQVLGYLREHASEVYGPYGPIMAPEARTAMSVDMAAGAVSPTSASPDSPAQITNVQVAGVDEGDVLKLSGGHLLSVADGQLRILKPGPSGVQLVATLKDATYGAEQLLVSGDKVLVIGRGESGALQPPDLPGTEPGSVPLRPTSGLSELNPRRWPGMYSQTRIDEVDLKDPRKPVRVRSLFLTGTVQATRSVGDQVRLVLNSRPRLAVMSGNRTLSESEAAEATKKLYDNTPASAWLPQYELVEKPDAQATARTGSLLDCANLSTPGEFTGLETLSLLTIDLSQGLDDWKGSGVITSGGTVYATADHTYIASVPWRNAWGWAGPTRESAGSAPEGTGIHRFDTAADGSTTYVGSGRVPGRLLNQFAMDESGGHLRVATTLPPEQGAGDAPAEGAGSDAPSATVLEGAEQAQVSVLKHSGLKLSIVGKVAGIGHDESIFGVRFMGDRGYVVTYRQTDPLFVLDLSDPARPAVTGELKMPGYSSYLHPLGEDQLIGVGQDGDNRGRTTGAQLSIFDVSDPAKPVRTRNVTLPNAWSAAQDDHHAFTLAGNLVLMPYTGAMLSGQPQIEGPADAPSATTSPDPAGEDGVSPGNPGSGGAPEQLQQGVLAVDISQDKPVIRTLRLPDGDASPLRTTVIDGRIYTLTLNGMATHTLTGDSLDYLKF